MNSLRAYEKKERAGLITGPLLFMTERNGDIKSSAIRVENMPFYERKNISFCLLYHGGGEIMKKYLNW